MTEAFWTPIALALLIVPGFLFRAAYLKTRAHGAVETDLYALAEAVVLSLVFLLILWWWTGETAFAFAEHHKLGEHPRALYWLVLSLIVTPYLAGLVSGWTVAAVLERVARAEATFYYRGPWQQKALRLLNKSSLLDAPTVWDDAWHTASRSTGSGPLYVKIRTKTGNEIVGAFVDKSKVGLSPEPRQIYLRTVYRPGTDDWEEIPNSLGVFVDAAEIESIEFAAAEPIGAAGDAAGTGSP